MNWGKRSGVALCLNDAENKLDASTAEHARTEVE